MGKENTMKVATRNSTKQAIVTKRFEVRLNEDAVNAYKRSLQQQQQHQKIHRRQETHTKHTTIRIVGTNNRHTIHTMSVASASTAQMNRSVSSAPSSSDKTVFQRTINDCFNSLMTLNEQHAHAKINLKTEYNAKLEQLKRDFERRAEEIKQKCISDAGF